MSRARGRGAEDFSTVDDVSDEEDEFVTLEAFAVPMNQNNQNRRQSNQNNSMSQWQNEDTEKERRSSKSKPPPPQKHDPPAPKFGKKGKEKSFAAEAGLVNDGKSREVKAWPAALKKQILRTFTRDLNEAGAYTFLEQYAWPRGLKETVLKSCRKVAMRFFLVDDSGSMITNDGKRIMKNSSGVSKVVKCTRWSELSETVSFLAELSESMSAPSEFRLLNGADPIIVGLGDDEGESLKFFKECLQESPAGPTPLCTHIAAIVAEISSIADSLRAKNQKAAVIICTDGESSDGNVAAALKPLTNLPVLVILRLCTNEQAVVDYWNNIDAQLELDIDVLDDQLGDAAEVYGTNPWLTYGEAMHRVREFGASMKELDIVDESTLSSEQMRIICAYLFLGGNPSSLPHPGADFPAFLARIKDLNNREPKIYCPNNNAMRNWVDINKLNKVYGGGTVTSGSCNVS